MFSKAGKVDARFITMAFMRSSTSRSAARMGESTVRRLTPTSVCGKYGSKELIADLERLYHRFARNMDLRLYKERIFPPTKAGEHGRQEDFKTGKDWSQAPP
jgi:hypothetical protein